MDYAEKAKELFMSGKNCSVSVVLAFKDILNIEESDLKKLAIGFGGGIGRQRLTCGAVSGMFMVLGALKSDGENRKDIYELVRTACDAFKEKTGSVICGDMLSGIARNDESAVPEERTESYYKKRPCAEIIKYAAQIVCRLCELQSGKEE